MTKLFSFVLGFVGFSFVYFGIAGIDAVLAACTVDRGQAVSEAMSSAVDTYGSPAQDRVYQGVKKTLFLNALIVVTQEASIDIPTDQLQEFKDADTVDFLYLEASPVNFLVWSKKGCVTAISVMQNNFSEVLIKALKGQDV